VFRVIAARFIGREVSEIWWLATMQICELSIVGSRPGCSGAFGLFRPESGGGKVESILREMLIVPFELSISVLWLELIGSAGTISTDESAGSDLLDKLS
jgi:hypothetical protein